MKCGSADGRRWCSHLVVLLGEPSLLDHGCVKEQLAVGTLNDFLLNSAFCHKAEHLHRFGLPDTVRAIHGLKVNLDQSGREVGE